MVWVGLLPLDPQYRHSLKEYFEHLVHVVHEHLLKGSLLLSCQPNLSFVNSFLGTLDSRRHLAIFVPHFQDYYLVDVPVFLVIFEALNNLINKLTPRNHNNEIQRDI